MNLKSRLPTAVGTASDTPGCVHWRFRDVSNANVLAVVHGDEHEDHDNARDQDKPHHPA